MVTMSIVEEHLDRTKVKLHNLNDKSKGWDDNFNKIATFTTVEGFWSVWSGMTLPSQLFNGTDYYLFKNDIFPKWEDKANQKGGRWFIPCDKTNADMYFEELMLLTIGSYWETDEEDRQICGTTIQVRTRMIKLAVWTANAMDQDTTVKIGKKIKEALKLDGKIYFQSVEQQKSTQKGKDDMDGLYVI